MSLWLMFCTENSADQFMLNRLYRKCQFERAEASTDKDRKADSVI